MHRSRSVCLMSFPKIKKALFKLAVKNNSRSGHFVDLVVKCFSRKPDILKLYFVNAVSNLWKRALADLIGSADLFLWIIE